MEKKEASLEALQFSDVEKVLFGIFIPKILSTKPALLFNNNKKKEVVIRMKSTDPCWLA